MRKDIQLVHRIRDERTQLASYVFLGMDWKFLNKFSLWNLVFLTLFED